MISRKILGVLTILHVVVYLIRLVSNYQILNFFNSDSSLSYPLNVQLYGVLGLTSCIIGVVGIFQLLKEKKLELNPALKFSMFLTTTGVLTTVLHLIFQNLDENYFSEWYWYDPLGVPAVLLTIVAIFSFAYDRPNPQFEEGQRKSKKTNRMINFIIDSIIVSIIILVDLPLGERAEFAPDNLWWNSYFIASVNFFIYYFVSEALFRQTIGKLHNDSYIKMKYNSALSAFLRTLCRLIPFEPISYLVGRRGWHDKFSGTSVETEKKEEWTTDIAPGAEDTSLVRPA